MCYYSTHVEQKMHRYAFLSRAMLSLIEWRMRHSKNKAVPVKLPFEFCIDFPFLVSASKFLYSFVFNQLCHCERNTIQMLSLKK